MSSNGRRVVVVTLVLAGVFLPLWLMQNERASLPPDNPPVSQPPANPSKSAPAPVPPIATVRLPPPDLHRAANIAIQLKTLPPETVRPVLPLKPTSIEPAKHLKQELAVLKPSRLVPDKSKRKHVRTLLPTPITETVVATPSKSRERPQPKLVKRTKLRPSVNLITQPQSIEFQVRSAAPEVRKGRVLLKLLEHGKGPTIEIAWPRNERDRNTLFRYLNACYGMQTALLDGQGRLYLNTGERGRKWKINMDQFSGFVRQPDGYITLAERSAGEKIRRYHGLIPATRIVRIFPRVVDAALLGGLKQLLGTGYASAHTIRGRYKKTPRGLVVDAIIHDGRMAVGAISFPPFRGASCG